LEVTRGEFEEVPVLAKCTSVPLLKGVVDHNIAISAYQMSNTLDLIRKTMMWGHTIFNQRNNLQEIGKTNYIP
jgi:hypothetical protein